MALLSELNILKQVKLPNQVVYTLVDGNGRAMLAPNFLDNVTYTAGSYVIYNGDLYKANKTHNGAWTTNDFDKVTVGEELKDLYSKISGGIHYIGQTTTKLYNGATTNPIVINSSPVTAVTGDMVSMDLSSVAIAYQVRTEIPANTYVFVQSTGQYYYVKETITASENTSYDAPAVEAKMDQIRGLPTFLFDGTKWISLGGLDDGLGDLAFKDYVQSEAFYHATGTGSASIPTYVPTKVGLATANIRGVNSTVSVTQVVTDGAAKDVAKAGTPVRYGTADRSITGKVYGTADRASTPTTVGNANVGTVITNVALSSGATGSTINYGQADVGDAVTVATRGSTYTYGTADVGKATRYGTANAGTFYSTVAELDPTAKIIPLNGITVSADDANSMLIFNAASTGTVYTVKQSPLSITSAVLAPDNQTLTPAVAASGHTAYEIGITAITPAKAALSSRTAMVVTGITSITPATSSSTQIYGAVSAPDSRKIYEAIEATAGQTLIPAAANGTIQPFKFGTSISDVAISNPADTTVVTGIDSTGTTLVSGLSTTASVVQVTVNREEISVKSK